MTAQIAVGYDPEIQPLWDELSAQAPRPAPGAPLELTTVRAGASRFSLDPAEIDARPDVERWDVTITGSLGGRSITLTVIRPTVRTGKAPAIYHMHGGGLIAADRYALISGVRTLDEIVDLGVVFVTVEYNRAPENPAPGLAEDCYSGLLWLVDNADELGIDLDLVFVAGRSAGACLSALVAIMARDLGGPRIAGQVLEAPMFDDSSASPNPMGDTGPWNRERNIFAWRCALGANPDFSTLRYAVPARETNLRDLPAAYISVGSAELFRDEAIEYANRLWAQGADAELHVWPGGYHGHELNFPDTALAQAVFAARRIWMRRMISRNSSRQIEESRAQ
jgi:acetyl esterase/lipase